MLYRRLMSAAGILQSGGDPWTPIEIQADLDIWFDASDSSTITIDTGVSVWTDKSNNVQTALQPTPSLQPTMTTINGLDAVHFDGSVSKLSSLLVNALTSPLNIFIVTKSEASVNNGDYLYLMGNLFVNYGQYNLSRSGTGTLGWYQRTAAISSITPVSTPVSLFAQSFTTTSPFYKVFVNTELQTTDITLSQATNNASGQGMYLGGTGDPSFPYPFLGDIGEFIAIEGTLLDTTTQTIEGYLAHKWGFEDNIPIGHPYKNAPPYIN